MRSDYHKKGYYAGISKQLETLLWTIVGICYTIFDTSLFHLKDDLFKVWSLRLDPIMFSESAQIFMKYLISGIVLIRTLSVHLYLAMYIVMLWPIIFEDRPGLILPWLTVGAIRNVVTVFLSFVAGCYICLMYFFTKLICFEFLLAQLIEHGPSLYMWMCVLSFYKELKLQCKCIKNTVELEEIVKRRRRTRSLMRKLCFYDPNADRQLVSISTIENVVNQLTSTLHRSNTRSLDSLLTNLAAEADQEEILSIEQIKNIEEETDLSVQEKIKKLLNISESEVEAARLSKNNRSLCSISNFAKCGQFKEIQLKAFSKMYNPKSEHSMQTRVQSDPTVFHCSKSGKMQTQGTNERSETEIRTITMSDDASSSIFFKCNCDIDVDSMSSNDINIISNTTSKTCECLDCKTKVPEIEQNTSLDQKVKSEEKQPSKIITITDGDSLSLEEYILNSDLNTDAFCKKNSNNKEASLTKTDFTCPQFFQPPTVFVYTLTKTNHEIDLITPTEEVSEDLPTHAEEQATDLTETSSNVDNFLEEPVSNDLNNVAQRESKPLSYVSLCFSYDSVESDEGNSNSSASAIGKTTTEKNVLEEEKKVNEITIKTHSSLIQLNEFEDDESVNISVNKMLMALDKESSADDITKNTTRVGPNDDVANRKEIPENTVTKQIDGINKEIVAGNTNKLGVVNEEIISVENMEDAVERKKIDDNVQCVCKNEVSATTSNKFLNQRDHLQINKANEQSSTNKRINQTRSKFDQKQNIRSKLLNSNKKQESISIKYPKNERYHHDGFVLDYMCKLNIRKNNAQSSSSKDNENNKR